MKILFWLVPLLGGLAQVALGAGLTFGPFGDVIVRGREQNPTTVLIVLSDVGGWNTVEECMARVAEETGALVLGVDTGRYLRQIADKKYEPNVSYELESMSKYAQKTLNLTQLSPPPWPDTEPGPPLSTPAWFRPRQRPSEAVSAWDFGHLCPWPNRSASAAA